jgi:hypothetical protein
VPGKPRVVSVAVLMKGVAGTPILVQLAVPQAAHDPMLDEEVGMYSMRGVLAATASAAAVVAGTAAPAMSSRTRAAGERFLVSQVQFPLPLVVRGERVEIGYDAQKGPNRVETPSAIGTLFVRNDRQRSFTAVPLKIRQALQRPSNDPDHVKLRALVPERLLTGSRLFYYAVISNRRLGVSVTVPAAGAKAPETVLIINRAFRVDLGTHVFGHPQAPEAIVAKAGPTEVGFARNGLVFGPKSFGVTKEHSVWLWDSVNRRMLTWAAGSPNVVARRLQLPLSPGDVAAGPGGSAYLFRDGPRGRPTGRLTRLSARGKVVWTSTVVRRPPGLVTGPGGTLYATGPQSEASKDEMDRYWWGNSPWVPMATPDGRPLSLTIQGQHSLSTEPLPGGMRLARVSAGHDKNLAPHEMRVALLSRAGRILRSWRIRSRTVIWKYAGSTLVAGDPVIVLWAQDPSGGAPGAPAPRSEYVVLRLGPRGGIRTNFSLVQNDPPRSAYGDGVINDIRVEPDGKLYQLGSAPGFGAAISRYSLRRMR